MHKGGTHEHDDLAHVVAIAMPGVKQTLQLRHQLACSGVTIQSAAYDTARHHVLTYDSHVLAPHMLRLFSLRREIKNTRLFDEVNPPRAPLQSTSVASKGTRSSSTKPAADAALVPIVHDLSLIYAATIDVYICVYTAQSVPLARAKSSRPCDRDVAVYNVLFLEPATLKKLVHYPGPSSHRLRCLYYDASSDRLVLAIETKARDGSRNSSAAVLQSNNQQSPLSRERRSTEDASVHCESNDGDSSDAGTDSQRMATVDAPMHNHVAVLQVSKRAFQVNKRVLDADDAEAIEMTHRIMLCVERTGAPLLHVEALDAVCGAQQLTRLFGVSCGRSAATRSPRSGVATAAATESVLLEWRENSEKSLELIRRVTIHDAIPSLALSCDATWLFTGHASGAVRVWNVSTAGRQLKLSATYALGSEPLETDRASWHASPVLSLHVRESSVVGAAAEAMVVTADRDSGVVKHWRFQVTGASNELRADASEPRAHIALVGSYSCDTKAAASTTATASTKRKRAQIESERVTLTLCVAIDMGGFSESLLLVLRDDVIHVLKVQTVMHVLETFASGNEVSALRLLPHEASCPQLVVVSGSHVGSVRVLEIDTTIQQQQRVCSVLSLLPHPSQRSASVSAIECFCVAQGRQQSPQWFLAVGWSTGSIDIQSLETTARVAALQDARLNVWISSLSVVTRTSATHVVAGTEDGQLFGWRVPTAHQRDAFACHLVLEASAHAPRAHSAHIVQLARFGSSIHAGADRLLSLGADGMVKVWDVPSLTMLAYVNAATAPHTSLPSCLHSIRSAFTDLFLAVGFDDGMLAVWRVDERALRFTELSVSSHHERRVTRIASAQQQQTASARSGAFVTSSLDMTAILWSIEGDGVSEQRYFDVGAPVADLVTVENRAVVALATELCAFEFCQQAPPASAAIERQTLGPTRGRSEVETVSSAEHSELSSLRPDTPTTHSDSESEIPAIAGDSSSPNETAERMVRMLRTPVSGVASDSLITVPSVLGPSLVGKASAAPVEARRESRVTRRVKEAHARSLTDVSGDVLCELLESFVETRGSQGTIAAESLSLFLATHRFGLTKRPDFAIRQYLQAHRIDVKTRLSVFDACETLLAIHHATLGQQQQQQQQSRRTVNKTAQRQNEATKRQAKRKAVVSFNILGEKTIRWEASETTPREHKVTDERELDAISLQPELDTPASPQRPVSPSIRVPTDQVAPPLLAPTELTADDTSESTPVMTPSSAFTGFDDDDDDERTTATHLQTRRKQRGRTTTVTKRVGQAAAPLVLPDPGLVERLTLSTNFQPLWSSGYCWCGPSARLCVTWSSGSSNDDSPLKCSACLKRTHALALTRHGYTPHFSLRAILGVIADVYDELLRPSHALLFKSGSARAASRPRVSIHAAIYRVFTHQFGMPAVVEAKIKAFFVSATHYVYDVDAVAVFSELVGMFASASTDCDIPDEMAALCVCCYAWFFSRALVVNGDALVGSSHHSTNDTTPLAIESGRRSHWQFVTLESALVCAQENLLYPLVSPGYLRNIVTFTGEYAQSSPSRPQVAGDADGADSSRRRGRTQWIEVHRFLRLLVGEWKQQSSEFRVAERTLFAPPPLRLDSSQTDPQTEARAALIAKLRLILSCFIFYDPSREGVMPLDDFTRILRKLRYLWPNEHVTEEEAAREATEQLSLTFENTILAAKRRFGDVDGDGQICYLDFWAMLYIVGVRTLTLLKFREIPSFCRDYKLEISMDLHDLLMSYMVRSSSMVLPQGFQLGTSSFDQRVQTQHQRRVGGLHDGVFRMPKSSLSASLSLQELVRMGDASSEQFDPKDQIYVDGTAPALGQSASVSAMDRFRPVTRDAGDSDGQRGTAPVVAGVRPTGPRDKPRAFLSVSALTNDALPGPSTASRADDVRAQQQTQLSAAQRQSAQPDSAGASDASPAVSSVYVQFPFVTPQTNRVAIAAKPSGASRSAIVGRIAHAMAADETSGGAYSWHAKILQEHESEERASFDAAASHALGIKPDATHALPDTASASSPLGLVHSDLVRSRKSVKALLKAVESAPLVVPETHESAASPIAAPLKRKKSETVVVIPTIDKDAKALKAAATGAVASPVVVKTVAQSLATNAPVASERAERPAKPAAPVTISSVHETLIDNVVALDTRSPAAVESVDERYQEATARTDVPRASDELLMAAAPVPTETANSELDASLQRTELVVPAVLSETSFVEVAPALVLNAQPTAVTAAPTAAAVADTPGTEALSGSDQEEDGDEDESRDGTDDDDDDAGESPDLATSTTPEPALDVPELLPLVHLSDNSVELKTLDVAPAEAIVTPTLDHAAPVAPAQVQTRSASPVLTEPSSEVSERPSASDTGFSSPDTPVAVITTEDSPPAVAIEAFAPSAEPLAAHNNDQGPVNERARTPGLAAFHAFRFSQQPAFRSTAPVFNNPLRSEQWHPAHDSDSEEEARERARKAAAATSCQDLDDGDESDGEGVDDIELQLTPEALQAYRATFGPRLRRRGVDAVERPTLRHFGLAASAVNQLRRASSRSDYEASTLHRKPSSRAGVSSDASGMGAMTLYDSPAERYRSSGITLSIEDEAQTQHKWLSFFANAEAALFLPLKQELREREEAQRLEDELQSRLMKKRQDQQAQDTLRLTQSRHESAGVHVLDSNSDQMQRGSASSVANFRLQRMTRESCYALQRELAFGVNIDGELAQPDDAQYFFFEYDPSVQGAILTLLLQTHGGDAELFLSTETKAPCVRDFMWRSTAKRTSALLDTSRSHKLVLYPHDLAKVVSTEREQSSDSGDARVTRFYVAVVALEPATRFALAVMASGQRMAPSRAIAMVDTLIGQFNELSKSFASHAAAPSRLSFSVPAPAATASASSGATGFVETRRSSVMDDDGDDSADSPHRPGGFLDRVQARRSSAAVRRESVEAPTHHRLSPTSAINERSCESDGDADQGDGCSENDDEEIDSEDAGFSFQHLLESIGATRGAGASRSKSFFLSGPTSDQVEFIQDEVAHLEDTAAKLSPERRSSLLRDSDDVMSSKRDAIAVLTDGRLSLQATRVLSSVRTRAGKSVKPHLSPLRPGVLGNETRRSASVLSSTSTPATMTLRVAQLAPKPVAYSLSSLDRSAYSLNTKSAAALPHPMRAAAVLPQVRSATTLR